jgi:2'-hydroxyisoflavone reductase
MAEARTLGVFNATGPAKRMTMADMLTGVAVALDVKPQLTWVPATFLDEQHIQPWSDLPVWVPGKGEDAGFAKRDIRKALKAGLTFRPLAMTSVDTLTWFRQQPPGRQEKLKAGLTPERESAALAAWKNKA